MSTNDYRYSVMEADDLEEGVVEKVAGADENEEEEKEKEEEAI